MADPWSAPSNGRSTPPPVYSASGGGGSFPVMPVLVIGGAGVLLVVVMKSGLLKGMGGVMSELFGGLDQVFGLVNKALGGVGVFVKDLEAIPGDISGGVEHLADSVTGGLSHAAQQLGNITVPSLPSVNVHLPDLPNLDFKGGVPPTPAAVLKAPNELASFVQGEVAPLATIAGRDASLLAGAAAAAAVGKVASVTDGVISYANVAAVPVLQATAAVQQQLDEQKAAAAAAVVAAAAAAQQAAQNVLNSISDAWSNLTSGW